MSGSLGNVVVTRNQLVWLIAWLHIALIGVPFGEFVVRGLTEGHSGFESLGWIVFLAAGVAFSVLVLLAALGIVVPLIGADVFVAFKVIDGVSPIFVLFGIGFLLAASFATALQGVVIKQWMTARIANRSLER